MAQRHKRGIFLISVMLVVLLITMFIGAAFELAPWAFRRTGSQSDVAAAQQAARSGLEYALARVQANPAWRAAGVRKVVVNDGTLTVVEQQGNVVGLLNQEGQLSQFRIRFNYQDGAGGADGLPDPGALAIQSPWISFNNLPSNSQVDVPRADGPNGAVTASPVIRTQLPPHAVHIVVEGRAGDWLRTATANNINPAPGFGTVSAVQIESTYKLSTESLILPSVLSAAGEIKTRLPNGNGRSLRLDSADRSAVPRIRTRGNLTVQGGPSNGANLTAARAGEFALLASGVFSGTRALTVTRATEGANQDFYNIKWSQVRQADGSNVMPAGVYTVDQQGLLRYYPMSLADYNALMTANPASPGVTPTLPASVAYTHTNGNNVKATFTVKADTLIQPAGLVNDIAIIPKKGVDPGPDAGSGTPTADEWSAAFAQPSHFDPGDQRFHYDANISNLLHQVHNDGRFNWSDLPNIHAENLDNANPVEFRQNGGGGNPQDVMAASIPLLGPKILAFVAAHPTDPSIAPALTSLGLSNGGLSQLPNVSDTLRASDITVKFKPNASSAVLSAPGTVTLGAKLTGDGGSIASAGSIKLVGLGVDFSATSVPNEGVSLYSKKDVLISTYDSDAQRYRDVALKGVVYCWGNLTAVLGNTSLNNASKWAQFKLTGALIAYGKDPEALGAATAGKVNFTAGNVLLKFDPSYINNVGIGLPSQVKLVRSTWEQH